MCPWFRVFILIRKSSTLERLHWVPDFLQGCMYVYLYYTAAFLIEMTCAICRSATLQKRMLVYAYTHIYIYTYVYIYIYAHRHKLHLCVYRGACDRILRSLLDSLQPAEWNKLCAAMWNHASTCINHDYRHRSIALYCYYWWFGSLVCVCVCVCCGAFGVCAYAAFFLLLVSTPSLFCAMPKGESSPRNVHRMDSA